MGYKYNTCRPRYPNSAVHGPPRLRPSTARTHPHGYTIDGHTVHIYRNQQQVRGGRGHVVRPRTRSAPGTRHSRSTMGGLAAQTTGTVTTVNAWAQPEWPSSHAPAHTCTVQGGEKLTARRGRPTGPNVCLGTRIPPSGPGGLGPVEFRCPGGLWADHEGRFEPGRFTDARLRTVASSRSVQQRRASSGSRRFVGCRRGSLRVTRCASGARALTSSLFAFALYSAQKSTPVRASRK